MSKQLYIPVIARVIGCTVVGCTVFGCSTMPVEQERNDGSVMMYRANTMTITVLDENGAPLQGAAVSVGTAEQAVAYALISEINKTPLVTPDTGSVTLSTDGMWSKDWWTTTECVKVNGKSYCDTQGSGHPKYEEYLIVNAPGFNEFREKYVDIVECRVAGPICKTVVEATDAASGYLINYTVRLTSPSS